MNRLALHLLTCDSCCMQFALVAHKPTPTNLELARVRSDGAAWQRLRPKEALNLLGPRDVALGRLDVRSTLDGVEDGLWGLGALAARGVIVMNDAASLFAMHDKLLTARLLRRAGIRHPRTVHVRRGRPFPAIRPPVVVKPRFGSGGMDVTRCDDQRLLDDALDRFDDTPWFRRHGALVQECIPSRGYDLRLVVAGRRVAGAVLRVAAEGEWRTNITLGGIRQTVVDPPREACDLAVDTARAVGSALAGIDLMLDPCGHWNVIEVNGAVEFNSDYLATGDVFSDVAAELERWAGELARTTGASSSATA